MPVSGYTYIDLPFAASGSVTAVPDPAQGDGSVSFYAGYGANYTLAQGSPGSLNVEEVKMNYLFNLITTILQTHQQQTIAPWIPTAANNGTPYPYSQYSLAMYTNGIAYISLVNSNTVLPGSDSTKWQPITLGTGLVASANLSDLGDLATAQTNLGFAQTLSGTGSQTLPGGLIIKWGIVSSVNYDGTASVTFASAFPNNFFQAFATISRTTAYASGNYTAYAGGGSTTGMTLVNDIGYNTTPQDAQNIQWLAIGN